jgi:hypothetical protein
MLQAAEKEDTYHDIPLTSQSLFSSSQQPLEKKLISKKAQSSQESWLDNVSATMIDPNFWAVLEIYQLFKKKHHKQ